MAIYLKYQISSAQSKYLSALPKKNCKQSLCSRSRKQTVLIDKTKCRYNDTGSQGSAKVADHSAWQGIKAMYKKIRLICRDSIQQSGLSRIQVSTDPTQDPKKCNDWTTIDNPQEMTWYLLERNQKHFGQAAGTPFTLPPLCLEINFSASTQTSELI
jgi:hypothetical protein